MSKLQTPAACACMLGVGHEDKHICGAADFVRVSGLQPVVCMVETHVQGLGLPCRVLEVA